jgi:hypothetical protein
MGYVLQVRLVDESLSTSSSSSSSSAPASSSFVSPLAPASAPSSTGRGLRQPAYAPNHQQQHQSQSQSQEWDLQVPLDLALYVKCPGGQAYVSLEATGLSLLPPDRVFAGTTGATSAGGGGGGGVSGGSDVRSDSGSGGADNIPAFSHRIRALQFSSRAASAAATYALVSAASSLTFARHPDVFSRIEREVAQVRAWMGLKLQLVFPPMFRVIFDAEAVSSYERIFSAIMKVPPPVSVIFSSLCMRVHMCACFSSLSKF